MHIEQRSKSWTHVTNVCKRRNTR